MLRPHKPTHYPRLCCINAKKTELKSHHLTTPTNRHPALASLKTFFVGLVTSHMVVSFHRHWPAGKCRAKVSIAYSLYQTLCHATCKISPMPPVGRSLSFVCTGRLCGTTLVSLSAHQRLTLRHTRTNPLKLRCSVPQSQCRAAPLCCRSSSSSTLILTLTLTLIISEQTFGLN